MLCIYFFLVVVKESFRGEVCCRGFRWGFGVEFGGWG